MNIRIRIEPTDLTHLMCIACGGFRTEYGVRTDAVEGFDDPVIVGVHKKCLPLIKAKNATKGERP